MAKITNQSTLTSKYTLPDYSSKTITTQSNVSETENMSDSFSKIKSCARTHVVAGDEVVVELQLKNDSPYEISEIQVVDGIGSDGKFVEGSVEIDGASYPTFSVVDSFSLPNSIASGGESVVSYKLNIVDSPQTTSVSCISNISYEVNGVKLGENSNSINLTIETVNISIDKTSNVEAITSGQELTFQNVIRNDGTVNATDLFFSDPIPEGTTFVENSVLIDGTTMADYNPETGFRLPDLNVGNQTIIKFRVLVN